jgi:hypothetical protein
MGPKNARIQLPRWEKRMDYSLLTHTSVHSGVHKSQNKPDKEILAFTFSIKNLIQKQQDHRILTEINFSCPMKGYSINDYSYLEG